MTGEKNQNGFGQSSHCRSHTETKKDSEKSLPSSILFPNKDEKPTVALSHALLSHQWGITLNQVWSKQKC